MKLKKIYQLLSFLTVGMGKLYVDLPSLEFTKQNTLGQFLDPTENVGRVRIGHFDFGTTNAAIADTFSLLEMPGGKVRILRVCVKHLAWAASATLALGTGSYVDGLTKATIAAAPAGLLAATAMNNTTDIDALVDRVYNSISGFTLTGLVAGGASTGVATTGWVQYVID